MGHRYLLMKSGREVNLMWLDVNGSCKQHENYDGTVSKTRFHKFWSNGRLSAYLCPNGLEPEEWARVRVDDPPGSWKSEYLAYKSEPPKQKRREFQEVIGGDSSL